MAEEVEMTGAAAGADTGTTPPPAPLAEIEGFDDGEDEETKKKKQRERSFWSKLWQSLAAGSLGLNIAAMAIEGSAVVIVAGVFAIIMGSAVVKFQCELEDMDSLRKVQNMLRKEVNRLQVENNKLSEEVTELQTQVSRLEETESKLVEITNEQGTNVDSLVHAVKENGKTIAKMKELVKGETMQTLMKVVLDSDVDGSFQIKDSEIEYLVLRLTNVTGVSINEKNFRNTFSKTSGSIESTFNILKQLEDDTIPPEERCIEVDVDAKIAEQS